MTPPCRTWATGQRRGPDCRSVAPQAGAIDRDGWGGRWLRSLDGQRPDRRPHLSRRRPELDRRPTTGSRCRRRVLRSTLRLDVHHCHATRRQPSLPDRPARRIRDVAGLAEATNRPGGVEHLRRASTTPTSPSARLVAAGASVLTPPSDAGEGGRGHRSPIRRGPNSVVATATPPGGAGGERTELVELQRSAHGGSGDGVGLLPRSLRLGLRRRGVRDADRVGPATAITSRPRSTPTSDPGSQTSSRRPASRTPSPGWHPWRLGGTALARVVHGRRSRCRGGRRTASRCAGPRLAGHDVDPHRAHQRPVGRAVHGQPVHAAHVLTRCDERDLGLLG